MTIRELIKELKKFSDQGREITAVIYYGHRADWLPNDRVRVFFNGPSFDESNCVTCLHQELSGEKHVHERKNR